MEVVTWLLQDFHGKEIEVTDMRDCLGISLVCMRVVAWVLKDCHSNEIEVENMNDWLSIRKMNWRVVTGLPKTTIAK